jgi:F-type H+-transporting ATPase subunit epsilon
MSNKTLKLEIVTQEKQLLKTEVTSVSVATEVGEITILPDHIPLFTKLATGELRYREPNSNRTNYFAISGGFMDVGVSGQVTVLADEALRADDINEAMAEQARQEAEEAMKNQTSQRDFILAEASLRKALNELKIANKRKSSKR